MRITDDQWEQIQYSVSVLRGGAVSYDTSMKKYLNEQQYNLLMQVVEDCVYEDDDGGETIDWTEVVDEYNDNVDDHTYGEVINP